MYTNKSYLHIKSHSWVQIPPLRPLKVNELRGDCNKPVTKQTPDEAKKAREVMDLIRGLTAGKIAKYGAPEGLL
jgi:hypothetical protein